MDQSKVKMNIFSRGSNFDSKGEEKKNSWKKQRGIIVLGGGQVIIG